MSLTHIPFDENRRIDLPGVETPVRRPVDVDQSTTGFKTLRTLRIYRFDPNSVIEGHAEDDEVYIVLLGGSLELTVEPSPPDMPSSPIFLEFGNNHEQTICAAYLCPGASYRLVSSAGGADVAYARATPSSVRPPTIFRTRVQTGVPAVMVLGEDVAHAELLRFRLLRIDTAQDALALAPLTDAESDVEALLHLGETVSTEEAKRVNIHDGLSSAQVISWDTVALTPGCRPHLEFPREWKGHVLLVMTK